MPSLTLPDRQQTLTVPQVAERLQIGRDSAYRLCLRPDFPAIRIGGLIRIPVLGFERWLAEQGRQLVRESSRPDAKEMRVTESRETT